MSKQVRLRRGTTAQHATFTGADGEVTFDTTKKVLVTHDGVTAGGKPVDGFVKLDPGAPLSSQVINTIVSVAGGDSDSDSFGVVHPARFSSTVYVDALLVARRMILQSETLLYAGTVNLDFGTFGQKRLDLTGNVTFTASNLATIGNLFLRLKSDGTLRTLTFPAGWRWIGAAAPANIAANKVALLWLWSFGVTDADVMARYLVEP